MKKIFKIASYDFKRLVLNPITIVSMIVVLIACIIVGFVYKIEPSTAYSATLSGDTTRAVFTSFTSSNNAYDNKTKLDAILDEGEKFLSVQAECFDYNDLTEINTKFRAIYYEIIKFKTTGSCIYIESNNIDSIKTASLELNGFINHFKVLEEFESNIFFQTKQFTALETISAYFYSQSFSGGNIRTILTDMHTNISNFDNLDKIVKDVFVWKVDAEKLQSYQTNYIVKATVKIGKIYAEMFRINSQVSAYDTEYLKEMRNLATNYKLTCESAKFSVENELRLALNKHFGNLKTLYNYAPVAIEETKLALTKANYFLEDKNLQYLQPQQALNFNTASYEVSLYDYAYIIISLVGFLTILFGIFCAYKLFGKDKKSGKVDILLSQNVTFGQVFAGKFLAIVFTTSFMLAVYAAFSLVWGMLFYSSLSGSILAIFNLTTAYSISPFLFFLIKLIGIELQVIFYCVIAVFIMNISRKFDLAFGISLAIFAVATICNIFFNTSLIYCLFPFVHADLTAYLGGATMQTGFLTTSLYAYGNFFISAAYYLVIVGLLYNFTKQLFKKN